MLELSYNWTADDVAIKHSERSSSQAVKQEGHGRPYNTGRIYFPSSSLVKLVTAI